MIENTKDSKDSYETKKVYSVDTWTEYIDEHITEHLTTAGLAEIFHYSPTHFRRIFRCYYQISVADYVRKRRLLMAAEDLRNGMKCKDVAQKYDFNTYAGFNRAFQKEFHILPQEYGNCDFEIINLANYYEEYKDSLVVKYVNLKEMKMIGHTLVEDTMEDADLPAHVCYWMDRDFPCLENTRFSCNVLRREEKIAVWYQVPEKKYIEYIFGPVVEEFGDDVPEEMVKMRIAGGKYAVFETEKDSDKEDFVETLRKYTRCVFYGWVKEYRNRVDLKRLTFERYVDNKVYFCVPVKY